MSTLIKEKNNGSIVREEDAKRVLAILRTTMPSLSKVDDQTAILAIAYAKHLGLDPLKKEIHLIPYWDKEQNRYVIQPIVAYTEYLKRAEASGKLDGWEIDFGVDKELGKYATVTIYRKDRSHPVKWTVYEKEVKKDTRTWKEQPLFMLRKVAISQAFRMAFPAETAHLPYEEAEQWDPEVLKAMEMENVHQQTEQTSASPPTQGGHQGDYITENQRKRFFAIVKRELGYKENFIKDILREKWGIESTAEIPKDKYEEIIEYFRMLSTPVEAEAVE